MSHLQQASARNLRNHPDSRNPIGIALWVVQKLDLVYQEKRNRPQAHHTASRASSVSSKAESPVATAGRQKNLSEAATRDTNTPRDHRKHLQTARKQRQREDNWVKNKENDVVARVRHNVKKKRSSGALEGDDQSEGETKNKRPKGSRAVLDPDLQASVDDAFDRAMGKTVNELAPRLSDQPEFCRKSAKSFIHKRKDQLDSAVWQAGILLVSVLPALTETTQTKESKLAANNLIDSLQSAEDPGSDDFFQALEVLVQSNVMVGVSIVMARLYPDRIRPFPETARTTKSRNSGSGPDYHQQNVGGDEDSDKYVENMNSGAPTRSSGRSRRQTKKYQEAYPGLISKRKRNTSTSPEATSPVQNDNPKNRSKRLRTSERSQSNASSEFDNTEATDDDDTSRVRAKPQSSRVTKAPSGTATNVTTNFNPTKSIDEKTSESLVDQDNTNNAQASFSATPVVPQIQISEDDSDMMRPELVKNLVDVMHDIDHGFYDTDSDDDDSEAMVSAFSQHKAARPTGRTTRSSNLKAGHHAQARTRSSDRILRSSKMPGPNSTPRSSRPSPLNITTNVEQTEHRDGESSDIPVVDESLSPLRQPIALPVNTIISAEEGKIASVHYARLAQQAGVPQGHPMSTGLSYPELIRPYTDKDGWTSTGVINEFGEEVIHIDESKWTVFDPATASHQSNPGMPTPRRLKSRVQAIEDRVFGFPPKPNLSKLDTSSDKPFYAEDIEQQTELFKARVEVDRRGLPFDRSMTVDELMKRCQDFDVKNAKQAKQAASTPAEDEVTSIEGECNMVDEDITDSVVRSDQPMSNGTPASEKTSPQSVGADSFKNSPPVPQQPPPAVGYSPVSRSDGYPNAPVDFHRPPASLNPFTSGMYSNTPSESNGPSRPMVYQTSDQPYHPHHLHPSSRPQYPNRPFLPPAPPYQQQKFTFVPPSDPSTSQKSRSARPPAPPAPPVANTATMTSTIPANGDQSPSNSSNQTSGSITQPPQGQVTPALNGGFPGGGMIINPRKRDERPVYKKKIGPDYKMELTNGRLARPGPNTPPQPTPKRGGMIIDFTGF